MNKLVWILAVVLCSTSFAYDIEDFKRDAKTYHESHLFAMNGLALTVHGDITQPGHDSFTVDATYSMRGNKWRADAVVKSEDVEEGFPVTVLFDGTQTWTQMLGMKVKVQHSDVDNRVRGYLYWEEPAYGSELEGEGRLNGHDCWVVTTPLKESDGTEITMRSWYDKEHFVLVQSETTLDGKPVHMEFSDFRPVSGDYVIPHAMRAEQEGNQIVSAKVIAASDGKGVLDTAFDAELLDGGDFPDMGQLMRTMQVFGKVFTKEVSKLLKAD
ncbi:MAG: hypothetical protein KDB65_11060 [Calditrichaeota bacterium]|nr:hypothetical protein [Calditrichota bacterium]MCB9369595.1 hypothetical protein [Calditrichota bacterium]